MNQRVVYGALTVSAAALVIGASILTTDWVFCRAYKGGNACKESLSLAATAWTSFGMNALALATNTERGRREDIPPDVQINPTQPRD